MRIMQRQLGFAMIEVMVTVAIITIGVSGMGVLLMRAIQGTQDSAQQSQAMWIVQDYVGRMRANPEGARAQYYELDPSTISCDPADRPKMCAETYQGMAEVPAEVCSVSEMAIFDNWISTCGLSTTIYDSASDFVVNPALTSTCTANSARVSSESNQPDCVQYEVELTWETKITKGSSAEDERINQNDYSLVVEFN